ATTLLQLDDVRTAQPLFERLLAMREKILGAEHPDTATSLHDLAFVLNEQGDLDGARRHYERAIAIREKTLDPEDMNLTASINNLAIILRKQGDLDRAENLETLLMIQAITTQRYNEALRHGEALVAIVEAVETKRDGKPGERTASAFQSVAWYALL